MLIHTPHSTTTLLGALIAQLKQKKDIKSQSLFHPDAFGYFVGVSDVFTAIHLHIKTSLVEQRYLDSNSLISHVK